MLEVHLKHEPPFIDVSDRNEPSGIEIDLLEGFQQYVQVVYGIRLQLHYTVHRKGYREIFPAVQAASENVVGAGSISRTESRAQKFLFSEAYMPDIELLITSKDIPLLTQDSPDSIRHYFQGCTALTGSAMASYDNFLYLRSRFLPDLKIDTSYTGMNQTLDELVREPRTMSFISLPLYLYRLEDAPRVTRQTRFKSIREGLAFILPLGSSWKVAIDEYLMQLNATQGIDEVLRRHLGEDALTTYKDILAEKDLKGELTLYQREQRSYAENLAIAEEQGARQRQLLWFIGLLTMVTAVFTGLVMRESANRKRLTDKLREQNAALEQQRLALEKANRDLSEMQDQVVRGEKLRLLGTLINIVAHQLNSPIGAIRSSARYVRQQFLPLQERLSEPCKELPPAVFSGFLGLLATHADARQRLSELPLKEREAVKQRLLETVPPEVTCVANGGAEHLLHLGVRSWGDIPPVLIGQPVDVFAAFAQVAKLLSGIDNIASTTDRTRRFVNLLKLYIAASPTGLSESRRISPHLNLILTDYSGNASYGISLKRFIDADAVCRIPTEWLVAILEHPILNAIQAMPHGGELVISVSQKEGYAEVSIRDTGPGIPKEIMDNLFEPFVSTKSDGEGAGLGLYLVYKTLTAVGGDIHIDTGPRGTTVTLKIP